MPRKFDHHTLQIDVFAEFKIEDVVDLLSTLTVRGTEDDCVLSDENGDVIARARVVESKRINARQLALNMGIAKLQPEFFGVDAEGNMKCDHCDGNSFPGVLICTFDDREEPRDGKVFIARHDECERYGSDEEAAEAVSRVTGWPVMKSYDWVDNSDSDYKDDPKFKDYYRVYFEVTLAEAAAVIYGKDR